MKGNRTIDFAKLYIDLDTYW